MTVHRPHPSNDPAVICDIPLDVPFTICRWTTFATDFSCDIVTIAGELDACTTAEARGVLSTWLDTTTAGFLHLDLEAVGFIDCSGISLLLDVHEQGNSDQRVLGFQSVSSGIGHLLRLCDLGSLLETDPDCQYFAPPSPWCGDEERLAPVGR